MRSRRSLAALTAVAVTATLALSGCGSKRDASSAATTVMGAGSIVSGPSAPSAQLLDAAKAQAFLAQPPAPVTVLDVRTPAEFEAGHLQAAQLLDWNGGQFAQKIAGYPKDATYFVYCRSGHRSAQATAMMRQLGFTNVYELNGGIAAWQQAGLPTTTA